VSSTLPASNVPYGMTGSDRRSEPVKAVPNPPSNKPKGWGGLPDKLFGIAAKSAAILTLVMLMGILLSLVVGALPAIQKFGFGFLTSSTWDPVKEDFGGLVMIYGTLATSFIALLIAVPVSFGIALFLTELSPSWLKRPLGTAIVGSCAINCLRYVGFIGLWPYSCNLCAATLAVIIERYSIFRGVGIWPSSWHRYFVGRNHFGDHDYSFHRLSNARCF
jgi:phosphate transport system permease protein